MKVNDWLKRAIYKLEVVSIHTARLDALVLLEDIVKKNRAWLLANPDFELDDHIINLLNEQIDRRVKHEPLAYIRGKAEFYGREFMVTPATLQPRPETETIIELLKKNYTGGQIADIGTGSGCIAITVKLEIPETLVSATEINTDAIEVAKQNAKTFGTNIEFYLGSLLEPLPNTVTTLLANLPYVPDGHTINQAAMQEPEIAIFGGPDGLDIYRELFKQINLREQKPKMVLTESLPFQHDMLESVARGAGYKLKEADDFIQLFAL